VREGIRFVPLIVDTFGAFGAAAEPHIKMIADALAKRRGTSTAAVTHEIRHRLSLRVVAGVAGALLRQEAVCRATSGFPLEVAASDPPS
jgi:hypothetical protein